MTSSPRKQYSPEYKQAAVDKALALGNTSATARTLGIRQSLLHKWIQAFRQSQAVGKDLVDAKADSGDLQRLRREVARLRMENDILKKATAYFSQSELERGMPG